MHHNNTLDHAPRGPNFLTPPQNTNATYPG